MSIDPFRVRVQGPLAPFAAGFAGELARQGYTPLSAREQMRLVARLSRWLALEGMDVEGLGASEVIGSSVPVVPLARNSARSKRAPVGLLQSRGVMLPPPRAPYDPADQLLEDTNAIWRLSAV